MTFRGEGDGGWSRAIGRIAGAAAAVAIGLAPISAAAEMCDLKVYDSSFGTVGDESDTLFARNEQFIICFMPLKDGFVSLWDRIPQDGPVERLAPNEQFQPGVAIPVKANERRCFGDGKDGYYLLMEAKDGVGLGRMWLVYSEDVDNHPDEQSFDSANSFKNVFFERRFGAGAMAADPGAAARKVEAPKPSGCVAEGSLDYYYRVVDEPGSG